MVNKDGVYVYPINKLTDTQIDEIKSLIIDDLSFTNSLYYKELSFTERLLVEKILEAYKIKAFSSLDKLK